MGPGSPAFDSGGRWSGPADNPGPWGRTWGSVTESPEDAFTHGVITGASGVACIGIVAVALVTAIRRCKKRKAMNSVATQETEPLSGTEASSEEGHQQDNMCV